MYDPFRAGKEWWSGVEMLRVLILSSTIGMVVRTCWMKMLFALAISLVFLLVFLEALLELGSPAFLVSAVEGGAGGGGEVEGGTRAPASRARARRS